MEEVLLKEFIPISDITMGEGIDAKQEGTKFYNWDDLMQWFPAYKIINYKQITLTTLISYNFNF